MGSFRYLIFVVQRIKISEWIFEFYIHREKAEYSLSGNLLYTDKNLPAFFVVYVIFGREIRFFGLLKNATAL